LIGGPLGTYIIERYRLRTARVKTMHLDLPAAANIVEDQMPEQPVSIPEGEDEESYIILKNLVALMLAMWVGSWVGAWFASVGITLPAYIGAMLVASVFRNFDDVTKLIGLSQRALDDIGSVALSLFITMAIMTLRLWELTGLALPLLTLLASQVVLVVAVSVWMVYRLMGRDYDAAVMSSGFCGFMLGITANAMANMEALAEKYGTAPRAFLVVPIVGAFFIDFTNALIITLFLNLWR